jgi:hypothetical protein
MGHAAAPPSSVMNSRRLIFDSQNTLCGASLAEQKNRRLLAAALAPRAANG